MLLQGVRQRATVFKTAASGVIAALVGLLSTTPASAECPDPAVREAVGLRVDEDTVRKLVNVALDYLPESVALPRLEQEIFSCPFSTAASVALSDTDLETEILSHRVDLEAEGLRVTARVNLLIEGEVEATLCDIPATDCRLRSTIRPAVVSGRVRPILDACTIGTEFEDVSIEVASDDVEIELSDCAVVSSVVDLVLWGFQSLILDAVVPFLEDYIVEDVPRLIEEAGIGAVLPSFSALGVDVIVAPDGLVFDASSVQVTARAWAEPSGPAAACVPADRKLEVEPGEPEPMSVALGKNEGARVGASQDFLQQLVLAAWGAGLLCFDLETLGVDLESLLEPIFPGVSLSTELRSASAPRVRLAQTGGRDLVLEVPMIEADVLMSLPGDAPVLARGRTGAVVSGRVVVDPASTAIAIEPVGLEILPTRIELPTRTLNLRPEGLQQLYDDTVVPLVFGPSGRLTLLDAVFSGAPLALEMVAIESANEILEVGLRVWEKPPEDQVPPRTVVSTGVVGPTRSGVAIVAASTDDQTPAPLMRHRVIVDGVPQDAIRFGQRFRILGLESGWRRLELRAVDLNDNVGEPVEVTVLVDSEAPTVELLSGPIGVLSQPTAEWRLAATDDHSKAEDLVASYVLEAWGPDSGARTVLETGELSLEAPLQLRNLPEDQLLTVTFLVDDEAGNRGRLTSSFAVDGSPTVGCRASRGGSATPLLLIGLGLALRRRRGDTDAS